MLPSGRISCAHRTGSVTIKTTEAGPALWAHGVRPDEGKPGSLLPLNRRRRVFHVKHTPKETGSETGTGFDPIREPPSQFPTGSVSRRSSGGIRAGSNMTSEWLSRISSFSSSRPVAASVITRKILETR